MTGFIRVRAKEGPKHEFHASTGEVEANPDLYEVVDGEVVSTPQPPTYITPKSQKSDEKQTPADRANAAAGEHQTAGDNIKKEGTS